MLTVPEVKFWLAREGWSHPPGILLEVRKASGGCVALELRSAEYNAFPEEFEKRAKRIELVLRESFHFADATTIPEEASLLPNFGDGWDGTYWGAKCATFYLWREK